MATARPLDRSEEWPSGLVGALGLAAVILGTLAYGAVDRVDRSLLTAALCGLGCVAGAAILMRGTTLQRVPGTLPLVAFIGWVFCQAIPISSPDPDFVAATGLLHRVPVSLVPAASISRGREALAMLVLFLIGAAVFRSPNRLRQIPWSALLLGTILAVYYGVHPFLEHVPPRHRDVDASRHVFGTYLSRNHLGCFFALASLLGAGLWAQRARILHRQAPARSRRQLAITAMVCANVGGLLLTGSRGAALGLLLGVVVLWLATPRRRAVTPRGRLAVLATVAALAVALPNSMGSRFLSAPADLTNQSSRGGMRDGAAELFGQAPITGVGFGVFPHASALTQPPTVIGHVEHVHCDPLELLAETGLFGVNLLLWGGGILLWSILRRAHAVRGDRRTLLAVGSVAALTAVAVQSTVDFPLQVPAIAGWIGLMLGAAAGAMATAHEFPETVQTVPRWVLAPATLGLGLAAVCAGQECWAYHQLQQEDAARRAPQRVARLERIAATHPGLGEALSRAAALASRNEDAPLDLERVRSLATTALSRNPLDARAQRVLAVARIPAGQSPAELADPLPALRRAARLVPPDDRQDLRIDLGLALLANRRAQLATQWFQSLFHDPLIDPVRVLQRLHRDGPAELDLAALVPVGADGSARDALRTLADQLLRAGEIQARERFLDLLLQRLPQAGRWTLREGLTLTRAEATPLRPPDRTIQVTLRLVAAPGYRFDGHMMRLSLLGAHGMTELAFAPRIGDSTYELPVPASLPPGRYDLAVQPFTKGARFPIRFFEWPETPLHLAPGRQHRAEDALYCELDPPRPLTRAGLPLDGRNRAWRRIRLSAPGGLLVVSCSDATPVLCTCDGQRLVPEQRVLTKERTYRLPADRQDFLLELRTAAPATTTVLGLTLLAGVDSK